MQIQRHGALPDGQDAKDALYDAHMELAVAAGFFGAAGSAGTSIKPRTQ